MIVRVFRKDRFITEPEVYCIVGTAPEKKVGCGEISIYPQRVGSVRFSANSGSFEPKCGEVQLYPRVDRTRICCGKSK
jgi:hypothetical protein